MAGGTSTPGDSVLARAHRMLSAFTEDDPELDVAELSARSGLPRSTVHRLAAELVRLGMLDRSGSRLTIGVGLWELGELSAVGARMRERALPHLLALYEATRENVHLAILSGTDALYVARLTGSASIPTLSRMGGRLPLHVTGVGKALLARRDDAWLDAWFALPRERETLHSITDEAALRLEIASVRELGYAVTRQEMTLGNVSVAAALPHVDGLPPAAVGVVTHLDRGDAARLAPLVMGAASAIVRDLAG